MLEKVVKEKKDLEEQVLNLHSHLGDIMQERNYFRKKVSKLDLQFR